jgi:hypothetical protein
VGRVRADRGAPIRSIYWRQGDLEDAGMAAPDHDDCEKTAGFEAYIKENHPTKRLRSSLCQLLRGALSIWDGLALRRAT